jgi:hypothetical protein
MQLILPDESNACPCGIWLCFAGRSVPFSGRKQQQEKDDAVKTIALAAMLALALCGPAQARLVELPAGSEPAVTTASQAPPASPAVVVLRAATSDLAEPQMIAMMLLGLCLIGYKASRVSSEKFK